MQEEENQFRVFEQTNCSSSSSLSLSLFLLPPPFIKTRQSNAISETIFTTTCKLCPGALPPARPPDRAALFQMKRLLLLLLKQPQNEIHPLLHAEWTPR
jgi:hypothetical protein